MIIDVHAHIFPGKIAQKAATNIGNFYGIKMRYDATKETLIEQGDRGGIDKFVVHSVATSPRQVDSINQFIVDAVEEYPDRFIGFASLHPESENIKEQFEWAMAHGLKGVKLHPDFQQFDIDAEKAGEIYKLCEGVCPVIIHMGDKRTQYSKAEKLVNVLNEYEGLDVIAAHFGGYSEWGTGAAWLATTRAYVDTSSSTFALREDQVRELVDIYTPERVLFGTDYPMWDAGEELERLLRTSFSEAEREMIFHGNIEKLLAKYEK